MMRWRTLLPFGVMSKDGRLFAKNAVVTTRPLPLPLVKALGPRGGHEGATLIGPVQVRVVPGKGVQALLRWRDRRAAVDLDEVVVEHDGGSYTEVVYEARVVGVTTNVRNAW